MTTTRLTALLLTALVLAAAPCAAQQGPRPGYDDPLAYAQDYYTQQAENATADPVTYVGNNSSPEAVENQTEQAAFVACWTAWHYSDGHSGYLAGSVCDAFFTPPETVEPDVESEEVNATVSLNETLPGAEAFLNETLDAVNDTVADSSSAVDRLVDATVKFLEEILGPVLTLALGIVDFVVATVEELVDGLPLVGAAAGDAVQNALLIVGGVLALPVLGAVDGIQLAGAAFGTAADAIADTALAAVDGVGSGLSAAGSAVAAAVSATGHGLGAAASAFVDGLQAVGRGIASGASATGDAAKATGQATAGAAGSAVDGVTDAAEAVGDAVADAAESVRDAMASWLGADDAGTSTGGAADEAERLTDGVDDRGLLDGLDGLL